jgi:DNA polymerase-3 subunit delta'
MNHFLEKKPHLGTAQTIVIPEAENMTISAANALLKTLEEPTENSYIILISEEADTLLPTVISRCQNISIRPPVGQSLLKHFGHNGDDKFVNLSHYRELSNAQSAGFAAKFTESVHQFLFFAKQRDTLLALLLEHKSAFRWLEKVIVDLMRAQHGWHQLKAVNSTISESALWDIYTLVQSANKQVKTLVQTNKQYVCEKLLVDINVALKDIAR